MLASIRSNIELSLHDLSEMISWLVTDPIGLVFIACIAIATFIVIMDHGPKRR